MKQTIFNYLELMTAKAMVDAGIPEENQPILTYATKKEFGDYQANGVLSAAKKLGTKPRDLAQKVIEKIPPNAAIEKVEIAGPGFLNFYLSPEWLAEQLTLIAGNIADLIVPIAQQPVIVIDYSGPNLAKEMHVGHLRSTIIGDCLARVFSRLEYQVIRQNHVGDWGTQFGMLLTHMSDMQKQGSALKAELADLESFYRDAKKRFDDDPEFAQRARDEVVKLQSGDQRCLAHWQEFISISLEHCYAVYARLGVLLTAADLKPESSFNPELKNIVESLKQKNLLTESEGAQCVFLDEFSGKDDKPLPIIVQKSDGGYLYATTDLAALQYRSQELKASRVLYVVDIRQGLHFDQVFALAKKAGFVSQSCVLEHIPFGTMMGKDGKPFQTRSGGTVKLNGLLDEAVERAAKVVTSKNPELCADEINKIAGVVGINAVKYADLSKNRKTNYIFEWDKMLSLEGNTAPYLMYAYARIQSILRQSGAQECAHTIVITEAEEKRLVLKMLQLPDILYSVARECMPNVICHYLYELAGYYMSFYEKCPVLKADAKTRDSRLGLCRATANTISLGFNLLGLKTLEKM